MFNVNIISFVSSPVNTKGILKSPVTTQDPAGIGEVADNGLGTVVAIVCPSEIWPNVSKAQYPCDLLAFTVMLCVSTV